MIPVSTMGGKIYKIDTSKIITMKQLKQEIYKHHPHVPKPFPLEEFWKLDIQLLYQGDTLPDTKLLSEITLGDECLYCMIKSKPISITKDQMMCNNTMDLPNKMSVMENYITSPLQKQTLPIQSINETNCDSYIKEPVIPHLDLNSDTEDELFFDCQPDNPFTNLVINKLLTRVDILEDTIHQLRQDIVSIRLH